MPPGINTGSIDTFAPHAHENAMTAGQLVKLNVLREMREIGSLRGAAIVGQNGGFVVDIRSGQTILSSTSVN